VRKLLVFVPIAFCLCFTALSPGFATTIPLERLLVRDGDPAAGPCGGEDTSFNTVPFWKVEVKPQSISIPEAEYPEAARRAGIEGATVVEVLVDTAGNIADAKVLKSSGNALLDESAVKAARRARFQPAKQRDKPVQVWVSIPFRFRLAGSKKTDPAAPARLFVRDGSDVLPPTPTERGRAAGLDSALSDLAPMLTGTAHGESLPRLAVTPFEELNGSVSDTGVYIAEVLESDLAASGRCRVVEREAVAQLLGVVAPTRAAVMDTTARRNLVRVFRLSGIVAGTVAHMDGGLKVMARVVNPQTGLITRTGEVWVRPEGRPQNIPPEPPPRVPPTYPPPPPGVIRFEGEDMKVLRVTGGTASRQDLGGRGWTDSWSGGAHLWWRNAKLGDRLELGFDVHTSGTYRLKLRLTKAYDYGIEQCYLDGHKLGEPMDLYNGRPTDGNSHAVTTTGPLDMGSHVLRQGQHKLEVRIVGINPKAVQSHMFGIDYLDLVEQGISGGGRKTERHGAYPDTVIATIDVGGTPHGIVALANHPYVYVCNERDHGVCIVNTDELRVVDTVVCGDDAWQIAASPDDRYVYVANHYGNTVRVIETETNRVVATVPVGDCPHAMACTPSSDRVYVANINDNSVSVIRTSDNTVVATVNVGAGPRGLCILPNGRYVYTANMEGSVSVLRTSDNTIVKTIRAPTGAGRAAASSDGQYVYVSAGSARSVTVIRTADNTVVGVVPVASAPVGGCGLPNARYAYISCPDANSLAVIKTTDNTVAANIRAGTGCRAVTASGSGDRVYTADHEAGTVSVLARQ
jgi:TonB family protein